MLGSSKASEPAPRVIPSLECDPSMFTMEFVESLSSEQFDMIRKFIETMPQVTYDASYECVGCQKKNELGLKGMNDFF